MDKDIFKSVTCPSFRPVSRICISQHCHKNPFMCGQTCTCFNDHSLECTIKSIAQLDRDIKNILKFQFFIVYSTKLKGESIYVAGRFAMQTRPPQSNQRFALTYDPIPTNSQQTISFRLVRIKGCVGIGVFLRQILQRHQFSYRPDNLYLNHGAYMLLSNNMLYSHSNAKQNGNFIKKFQVNEKDVIKVRYQQGKVTFISNFLEQSIQVEVPWGYHLHFGVYLYDVQDQVQLVNTFVCEENPQ